MVPLASGLACVVASALLAGCAGNVGGGTATTASNQPTQALAPQAVPPQASGAQALAPQSLAPQTLPPQATGSRPANTATASLQPTAIPAGARPSVGQPPIQASGQQTGNSPHRVVHVATAALPPARSTQPPRAPIVFAATAPASKPLPQSRSTRAAAVPTQSPPPVAPAPTATATRTAAIATAPAPAVVPATPPAASQPFPISHQPQGSPIGTLKGYAVAKVSRFDNSGRWRMQTPATDLPAIPASGIPAHNGPKGLVLVTLAGQRYLFDRSELTLETTSRVRFDCDALRRRGLDTQRASGVAMGHGDCS